MSEGTTWWKEIGSVIIGHPFGALVAEELKKLFQHVTPTDRNYVRYKMTGQMPLEDENLYNRADAEFAGDFPNLARMHSARVAKLASHMQDYYRLTMAGYRDETASRDQDDRRRVDNMKVVIRRNALMIETEWQDKVRIMNLDKAKADSIAEQMKKAVNTAGTGIKSAVVGIGNGIKTGATYVAGAVKTAAPHVATAAKTAATETVNGAKAIDAAANQKANQLNQSRFGRLASRLFR